jgi:ABC-type multidrug transport system fused ATPase/permease subunit
VKTVEKWADRVYAENDFGRSIATSVAGLIGLAVYLLTKDWVISAFSSIITFPIIRIIASSFNEKVERNKKRKVAKEEVENLYQKLSSEEKSVIQSFVNAGGSVLTWNQMNGLDVPSSGVESLIQREILWTGYTADGMRETFALDTNIFDACNEKMASSKNS